MSGKVAIGIGLIVVAVVTGYILVRKDQSRPAVMTALRIKVDPADQLDLVSEKARSPLFKYLIGKRTGVKPAQAQKLEVKTLPRSSLLEARVLLWTQEEGRQYTEAFVPVLQELCGSGARLSMVEPAAK